MPHVDVRHPTLLHAFEGDRVVERLRQVLGLANEDRKVVPRAQLARENEIRRPRPEHGAEHVDGVAILLAGLAGPEVNPQIAHRIALYVGMVPASTVRSVRLSHSRDSASGQCPAGPSRSSSSAVTNRGRMSTGTPPRRSSTAFTSGRMTTRRASICLPPS